MTKILPPSDGSDEAGIALAPAQIGERVPMHIGIAVDGSSQATAGVEFVASFRFSASSPRNPTTDGT